MKNTRTLPANWRDKAWPIGIVSALTAFVAFILAIVTISSKVAPEVVRDDYYDAGYNLKEALAREQASAGLGWTVTVLAAPELKAVLSVRDASGAPVDSLAGDVAFYRASQRELDMPARLVQGIGGGTYSVNLPRRLETGAWQAVVALSRGQQQYQKRISFFVDSQ